MNTRFKPQWNVKMISLDPVQTVFKTLPETDKADRPDRPKQMSSMSLRFSQKNSGNIPDMPKADSPRPDR